ncbi:FxSxx-COOH cyclophane-containing RiPP peptide [Actinomadura fibrosa]|uniref:FxSxx-COOH cyclophane-containing RiPP peptide n=1 Tax=Actinomadura fibrosa TaxID=111802 RepID=A0ABW2XQ29_9ACTN|nr:FxSxx-COOH cyclophane-containing RiPP peptide [Actinomadura fibrosa]
MDLSGTDLAALRPPEGSVLERALARLRRERARGGPGYAGFENTPSTLTEGTDVGERR